MGQLIDHFLPDYQFQEYHTCMVRGRPEIVMAALDACNLGASALVRSLFRLRGLPTGTITLARMEDIGFRVLGRQAGQEVVIGLIGRFWTFSGGIHPFAPEAFKSFDRPAFAKCVTNFRAVPLSPAVTRLTTETRVWCPTAAIRSRFRWYWFLIRPFSGLVRVEWLRLIKQLAERRQHSPGS
ncbi:MAG: hypothetical protein QNJ01_09235 [Desulfobacterales bacterium]|nr:hypothetical protein [Desulfobacterales bacterium]